MGEKKPEELKMNKAFVGSAVATTLKSDNIVERDLRIANIKSYANEPDY